MDDILEENENHKENFKNDIEYHKKCEPFYSILKACCTTGIALPKVNAYKSMKDWYKAWHAMHTHYFAKGDVGSYAANLLAKSLKLKLEGNTRGGADLA